MADLDLEIGTLELTMENVFGHEHRLRHIGDRALVLLQEKLATRWLQIGLETRPRRVQSVQGKPVEVDLRLTGDEAAANVIAESLLKGLLYQLDL